MTTAAMGTSDQNTQVPWWFVLIQGIAALILGFLLITRPGVTTLLLVQMLGWYWLFSGILSLVMIFVDRTRWGWKLFGGIVGILAGLAIVQNPLWSTVLVPSTLVWVLGIQGIVIGAILLVQSFQGDGLGAAILGILSIIFGIMLFLNPVLPALWLPWIFGILLIVGGIASIIAAFRLR